VTRSRGTARTFCCNVVTQLLCRVLSRDAALSVSCFATVAASPAAREQRFVVG